MRGRGQGTDSIRRLAAMAALALAACSERAVEEAGSEPATSSAPPASATPAAPPAPPPPLDLSPLPEARITRSMELADEARALRRDGKLADAAARYTAALGADPGNLAARYELGAVHAAAGDTKAALDALRAFSVEGCPACAARLVRARADADWEPLSDQPDFQALTATATVAAPPPLTAAEQIAGAFAAGDAAPVRALLHPRAPVTIVTFRGDDEQRQTVMGGHAVAAEMASWAARPGAAAKMAVASCKAECCTLDPVSDDGSPSRKLRAICFEVDPGGARTLTRVELAAAR
jgi:hypothetical protein